MRTASGRAAVLLLGLQSLVGSGCGSPGAAFNKRGIEYAKRGELAPNRVPELIGGASVAEVACRSLGGVPTRIMR
jgi:hypothetical protein